MTIARPAAERRHATPALAALVLHLLLAAAWWVGRAPPAARPPERPGWLRLLPADRVAPAATTSPAAPLPSRTPRAAGTAPTTPALPVAAPMADGASALAPPALEAITLPAPPPASAPPPLRLALPPAVPGSGPPSLRDQMLRDPRSNSRQSHAATEGLQGLGHPGPRLEEEAMVGEGHRRIRIGRDCFIVRESRSAQLDPHNQSTHPTPKQVDSCR